MIRFESVSKIYSTDVVLKNISWEIKKGEKVGLVGSNGAGKSTQFKILIGGEAVSYTHLTLPTTEYV